MHKINDKWEEEVARQFPWDKCEWWNVMTEEEKIKYLFKDYLERNKNAQNK
tara:strand:+ start:223 stop:375 length:153 start_codon:yes stop_codon:yes gene_type:complete